jgi:hypothetical protein
VEFPFWLLTWVTLAINYWTKPRDSILVGVGADDVKPADNPRLGADSKVNPSSAADALVCALRSLGGSAGLHVFTHAGHEETASMRQAASAFLHSVSPAPSRRTSR